MMLLIISMVLCGCDRPADEDCWRGPVPIVRVCDCLCGVDPDVTLSRDDVSAAHAAVPTEPLSLLVTRLMIDPTAVSDREGEWIEVHNPTPLPASLAGVEVAVGGSVRCMLPKDAIVPSFGFVVIARSRKSEQFQCPKLSLPNRRGEVALVRDDEVIDVVVWQNAPKGTPLSAQPRPLRFSP